MLEKRGKEPGLHGPWEYFIDGLQSIQKCLEIGRQVRGAYLRVVVFFSGKESIIFIILLSI